MALLAAIPGLDLAMSTNGILLPTMAERLATARLRWVAVSLDSLDDAVFRELADTAAPVRRVLDGIDAAERTGLAPVKLNMVVKRGVNARLSADGNVRTCLFSSNGTDLRAPLRAGASGEELRSAVGRLWQVREDRYSKLRGQRASAGANRVEMSYIGG